MKESIGPALNLILVLLLLCGICYPLWKLQRRIHYKWSYQSQVEQQIHPLVVRIENLEKRIGELENKK